MKHRHSAEAPALTKSRSRSVLAANPVSRLARGVMGPSFGKRTPAKGIPAESETGAPLADTEVALTDHIATFENSYSTTTSTDLVDFRSDDSEAVSSAEAVDDDPDSADQIAESGIDETIDGNPRNGTRSPLRVAALAGILIVIALTALAGWRGWRAEATERDSASRALFLEVGRQGALNLTTIDFRSADSDVQRIVDASTGNFEEDFRTRSKAFIDTVKQAQSVTAGSISEAGIESADRSQAQILVAVTVKAENVADPKPKDRSWRMRITVQKVGAGAKVSNVEFVV